MTSTITPLAPFGCRIEVNGADHIPSRLEERAIDLLALLADHDVVVIRGAATIRRDPSQLVEIGRLLGAPIDNRSLGIPRSFLLANQPHVFVNTNLPPSNRLPPWPGVPSATRQYPGQRGWHHDQSFIRTPPFASLLYGHSVTPVGGETLYASSHRSLSKLPDHVVGVRREVLPDLVGLHTVNGFGRTEPEIAAGCPVAATGLSARHRLVASCPVSGSDVLFLSDGVQMDLIDGPFVGYQSRQHGFALLEELMRRTTESTNVYVHQWKKDDLVLHSNFSVVHCATWYDHTKFDRVIWRVTVGGEALKSLA